MVDVNLEGSDSQVSSEIRSLAENMLENLEQGDVGKAVALVNDLNQLRDQTLYNEIGRLTRALHDSIKNLNVDTVGAASDISETTDKLAYVLTMTDKSANRTMDIADAGGPLAGSISERGAELSERWKKFRNREMNTAEFRELSKDIDEYLVSSSKNAAEIRTQFSEIVLAQDFQDLTGQVIHKVINLIRDVEGRLVTLVAMAGQVDQITGINHEFESSTPAPEQGPDITPEGPQTDSTADGVVGSQDDVDDLLSSLGF
ncbi:protein phosphatase CheZ [Thalassolituus sp.]|uniref:protein phosphatase CheZ n=1 Tax=Thalassolituus sp. TaxID=2030822 RepID=UPI0035112F96